MNILHINCNFLNNNVHMNLINQLELRGIKSTVYVPVSECTETIPKANVIISKCFRRMDRVCFGYKQNKIIRDITQMIEIGQYDLLHAHTLFTDGNCAYKLNQKYNIPYVVAIRNTDINYFFKYRFWLRKRGIDIIKNAYAVIILSESYERRLFNSYIPKSVRKRIESKIKILPNGIDDFWYDNKLDVARQLSDCRKFKILYVGKIDRNKNLYLTIKAINKLNQEGYKVEYSVVGEVVDKEVYNDFSNFKFIKYLGVKQKEELVSIYRDNDLFVMPSIHETFGMVYPEAMTQGLPIIYTKNEGFDNQFPNGKVGFAVECHNVDGLCNAIKMILDNYNNISKQCLIEVDKFRWCNITNKYKDIYESLIDN